MKKFLLLLLLAAPLCLLAQQYPYQLGHSRFTVDTVQGNPSPYGRIKFLQFLPPDYSSSATTKHPLIIFLHGAGESEKNDNDPKPINDMLGFALPKYLNDPATTMRFAGPGGVPQSFVVLIPQKHHELVYVPSLGWEAQAQFPAYYVDAMLKYARDENLNVDFSRVYLTGLSLGAGLVYDYSAYSDANARRIAAVVPVSGNPVYGYKERDPGNDLCNIAENKVASRAYVGSDDFLYSNGRIIINQPDSVRQARDYINSCVAEGKKTSEMLLAPGGHDQAYWTRVYDPSYGISTGQPELNMYTWMLQNQQLAQGALPVKLKYFKGKSLNTQNILEWATTLELNSDRIDLLRSADGEVYTVIASFKANGNSSAEKEYSYKDNSAPKGTSYYQLRQVDKDGKSELSRVVTLNNRNQAFVIEKYPNPVIDRLNVKIEGSIFGVVEIQILDLKGNLVKKMTIRKEQANWSGFVDVRELAKGMYMFHLKSSDGKKEVSSFIKN